MHEQLHIEQLSALAKVYTVQLTGNVAGTCTTRNASTRETCEGTGSPRGTASKTKTT